MESIFLKIVNISLVSCWLVLAVFVLRLALKRAPRWIVCLLWGLVALRLVLPFTFESAVSLVPSASPLPDTFIFAAEPRVDSGITAVDELVNPFVAATLDTKGLANSVNRSQIASFICTNVWFCGMAGMLLYFAVSTLLLRRRLATATLLEKGVKQSENVSAPFVLGVFRPTVYVPYGLSDETLACVLNHERAHISRRDNIWKPLGFLFLSVYWFDPLLWAAYFMLCWDIEAACDEKVIRGMSPDGRKSYSEAMLSCSIQQRMISACPVAFGESNVKSRIKSVMNYKKPAVWLTAVAVVACIAAAVCFLTDPVAEDDLNNSGSNTVNTGVGVSEADNGSLTIGIDMSETDGEPVETAVYPFGTDETGGAVVNGFPTGNYGYERAGFGGNFTITIKADGTMSYYEGMLSSYIGLGTWEYEDGVLTLHDNGMTSNERTLIFDFDGKDLYYNKEKSDNFIYIHPADGAVFSKDYAYIHDISEGIPKPQ